MTIDLTQAAKSLGIGIQLEHEPPIGHVFIYLLTLAALGFIAVVICNVVDKKRKEKLRAQGIEEIKPAAEKAESREEKVEYDPDENILLRMAQDRDFVVTTEELEAGFDFGESVSDADRFNVEEYAEDDDIE